MKWGDTKGETFADMWAEQPKWWQNLVIFANVLGFICIVGSI